MASEKELRKAAEELNDVLGLNPLIPTDVELSVMIDKMHEGITLIDPKLDEFSKKTEAIIAQLKAEKVKSAQEEAVTRAESELEDDEEEEVEEEISTPSKNAKAQAQKPPKAPPALTIQKTRASVMRDILLGEPMSSKQMVDEMHRRYGGSRAEALFQVGVFLRILTELRLLEPEDGDKLRYIGKYNA